MFGVCLQPLNHYNPMSTELPREIIKPLQALLGRVRRMQVLRGLAAVTTVVLGGLLLSMAGLALCRVGRARFRLTGP